MDLHGLISGPSPRSAAGQGNAPPPEPKGGPNSFGDIVASSRRHSTNRGAANEAGAESGHPEDPKAEHLPTGLSQVADAQPPGTGAGVSPVSQATEILGTTPEAVIADAEPIPAPGGKGPPVSDGGDAIGRPGKPALAGLRAGAGTSRLPGAPLNGVAPASQEISKAGRPAENAGSPARAPLGTAVSATPMPHGAPTSPPPSGAGDGAAIEPGQPATRASRASPATPFSSLAAGKLEHSAPLTASAEKLGATPLLVTSPAPGGDQRTAPGAARPGQLPGIGPKPAYDPSGRMRAVARDARPAPAAHPTPVATAASGNPPVDSGPEPGPGLSPDLPDLPAPAARGAGSAVQDAVVQARGGSDQIGPAASAAATVQTVSGPAQPLASALQANAGGAEVARTVAPQIVTAIGPSPGSGRIELLLDPAELGKVEISLEITDQSLRATLAAERPATNELLRRHGEVLLAQLQQAGFSEIDLQFTDNRAGGQGRAQPDDTPQHDIAAGAGAPSNDDNADTQDTRVARRATDGLDLRL